MDGGGLGGGEGWWCWTGSSEKGEKRSGGLAKCQVRLCTQVQKRQASRAKVFFWLALNPVRVAHKLRR